MHWNWLSPPGSDPHVGPVGISSCCCRLQLLLRGISWAVGQSLWLATGGCCTLFLCHWDSWGSLFFQVMAFSQNARETVAVRGILGQKVAAAPPFCFICWQCAPSTKWTIWLRREWPQWRIETHAQKWLNHLPLRTSIWQCYPTSVCVWWLRFLVVLVAFS